MFKRLQFQVILSSFKPYLRIERLNRFDFQVVHNRKLKNKKMT